MESFYKSKYRIPFDQTYYVYMLWLSIVYFLFRSIESINECESQQMILINESFLGLSIVCLMTSYVKGLKLLSQHLYAIGALLGFGFLWVQYGGVNGAFSYVYLSLLAIYAVILPGVFKIIYSIVLCVLCLVLTSFSHPTADQVDAFVVLSFIVNTTITGGTVLYLKWFYDKNRESYYIHNEKLDEVNRAVFKKKVTLLNQRKQIQDMKSNLQKLVASHTAQLQAKNQSLSEMAFSNAHYLRAPLTNVMAIIEMMKMNANASNEEIEQLESIAAESIKLDKALHKVNQLLDD